MRGEHANWSGIVSLPSVDAAHNDTLSSKGATRLPRREMRVPTSGSEHAVLPTRVVRSPRHGTLRLPHCGFRAHRKPWSPHVLPRARPSPTAGRHRVGHVLRAREPRVPGTRRLRNVSQDTAPESPQAERSQGSPDPARHWVRSDTGHGRKRLLSPPPSTLLDADCCEVSHFQGGWFVCETRVRTHNTTRRRDSQRQREASSQPVRTTHTSRCPPETSA